MKKVMIMGHSVLLARAKGRYYAADAICPHREGDLSLGSLKGNNSHLPDASFTV
jgi:nitrite reductase/ring-hydroxylating ferredoxin subunit